MTTLISALQRFKTVLFLKETVMSKFYAVAKGRNIGIFPTWAECETQVKNFPGARYKKFLKRSEAEDFIASNGAASFSSSRNNQTKENSKAENFHKKQIGETSKKIFKRNSPEDRFVSGSDSREESYPKYEEEWPEDDSEEDFEEFAKDFQLGEELVKRKQPYIGKSGKISSTIIESVGEKKYGNHMFPIDAEGYVLCYTDGSCENNGSANAVAGYGVYFDENHPLNTAMPVAGRATNNCGEIQGATFAVECAKRVGIEKLCINTDSQFLIKAMTTWLPNWKKRGWKLTSGKPVKNVDDFKALDEQLQDRQIKIKWNYVAGHKGIFGNEKADELAREGAQKYRDRQR